jgi:amidase
VENFGSITSPARANGVYGFRPAAQTISNEGIIVTTSEEDSAGPLCRRIQDCALIWDLIKSNNASPLVTVPFNLKGLKIGILQGETQFEMGDVEALKATLTQKGAETTSFNIDGVFVAGMDINEHFHCHFKDDLEDYLSGLKNTTIKTLQDIIDFNNKHPQEERLDELSQDQLMRALDSKSYKKDPKYCSELKEKYRKIGKFHESFGFETLSKKHSFDILIGSDTLVQMTNYAGYPSLAIPLGKKPDGSLRQILVGGRPGQEQQMLSIAQVLQDGPFQRVPPTLQ